MFGLHKKPPVALVQPPPEALLAAKVRDKLDVETRRLQALVQAMLDERKASRE